MAVAPSVMHKRGTRAAFDALAQANKLVPFQLYVITDERNRLVLALSTSSSQAFPAKYSQFIGNGSDSVINVSHNLGTFDCSVTIYKNDFSTYADVLADVSRTSANNVRLTFKTAPDTLSFIALVMG